MSTSLAARSFKEAIVDDFSDKSWETGFVEREKASAL